MLDQLHFPLEVLRSLFFDLILQPKHLCITQQLYFVRLILSLVQYFYLMFICYFNYLHFFHQREAIEQDGLFLNQVRGLSFEPEKAD